MRRMQFTLLLVISALFAPTPASACTCICKKYGDGSPTAMKERSAAVFVGEVLSVELPQGPQAEKGFIGVVVKFRVDRYWKGVKQPEIKVHMSWACCNMPNPKIGSKYLVYAVGRKREATCTRTRLLDSADEDLRALGSGKTLEQPNAAAGTGNSRLNQDKNAPITRGVSIFGFRSFYR